MNRAVVLGIAGLLLCGCSTESTRGAASGAATGAVTGAVGGMMTALVFGGNVGDAAARGAVYGGSTGAVAGGIQGARQAERSREAEKQAQQREMQNLKRRIGDDAYRGLEAMADCKHAVAIAYAESAKQSTNMDFALAGYWLEVMAIAETSGESSATAMLPDLVERDPKLTTAEQARILIGEVMDDLDQVRVDSGTNAKCQK